MLTVKGDRRKIDEYISTLKEMEAEYIKSLYPKNWDFTVEEHLKLIPLKEGNEEYHEVASLF